MGGCVLIEPPFAFAHVGRAPIDLGPDRVRIHGVIAQSDAFRANNITRLRNLHFDGRQFAFDTAALAHIEQRRKASGVAVFVVRQTKLFLSLFCLNIVEITQNLIAVLRADTLALP